jgi:hypothetical protein
MKKVGHLKKEGLGEQRKRKLAWAGLPVNLRPLLCSFSEV